MRISSLPLLTVLCLSNPVAEAAANDPAPEITLEVRDFATMPMTGKVDGKGQIMGLLARVNFMREEPGVTRNRVFVNDLNGPLYILDKRTGRFTTYLNFNGRNGQPGLFRRLPTESGFANGFICFAFDPNYAVNGKFYTIHLEDPEAPGSATPDNTNFPGLRAGYQATPAILTPGPTVREAVLIEWTDTDTSNTTFEGTARELMRLRMNTQIHPMADLIFNPAARPGDPDWRVLYIACGDGGSGESRNLAMRSNPQRLDTLVGKILRIVPDPNERKDSSTVSQNGCYRIPKDNPFTSKPGVRGEIWACGLRNPARLTWDFDPRNPRDNHLLASVIGLYTWETIVEVKKGANYGYSLREGNQKLDAANHLSDLMGDDRIPVQINATETDGTVTPTYPVLQYGHVKGGGDAISSGYVYRGKAIPSLAGKYIFGDITTGNVWWVDYGKMLAADVTNPRTPAEMHPVNIRWSAPGGGSEVYASMYPITELIYHARGGASPTLPGFARVPDGGRSDIHFWADSTGELYIMSKSDGMIRKIVGATVGSSAK
ncbi:MAG: PQQ-dependent sugar dehydrogenase [Bryobacteraceae bacterium]